MTVPFDRATTLIENLDLEKQGLEIGPLDKPIVPKNGTAVLYADHLPTDELREKYRGHKLVSSDLIQGVDIVVGPAGIRDAVGSRRFNYVVASHVIENIPNPLGWLNEIYGFLEPGGILSLAIPDKRYCFDRLRGLTTAADWAGAWLQKTTKPTPAQILDALSNEVNHDGDITWLANIGPDELTHARHPREALRIAVEAFESNKYFDVHCWVFTPASFCDLLRRLSIFGLLNFYVANFHDSVGHEFFIQLRKPERFEWSEQIVSIPLFWEERYKALPENFDAKFYLYHHPDIMQARVDPADHYLEYGRFEGRAFCEAELPAKRTMQHDKPGSAEAEYLEEDQLRPKYHGGLDRFSILNRVVVFEGWANEADIKIYYDHAKLNLSLATVKRPDLVPVFGKHAEGWGFAACATLPTNEIDKAKFRLRLSYGIPDANIDISCAASDKVFTQMVDAFRAAVAQKPDPSLLEIGSRARSGNAYREWFPEKLDYVGMDIHAGPNVDVVGDAHHLSRCVNRRFDFMLSISTFEHLLMPWMVALEMNKTLNDGGKALIISHPSFPLHEEPWDFFRFSKESWQGIFNAHTGFRVVDAQYQYPASIVPRYSNNDFHRMSKERTYLLSGCVIEKTGPAQVAWEAEASAVYDLNYSHA